MRRRQFLAAAAGLATVPVAAGRPSARRATDALQPLGTSPLDGLKEAVVGPDDETVYAAADDGFAVFDVSDPAAPDLLAERRGLLTDREGGPLRQIYDVKVDGDRLAVVGPANPMEDAVQAAVFFDVSDPTSPEQVGVYETDFAIHNCDFADGIAYLTGNRRERNDLVMVEAGAEPTLAGTWSIHDRNEQWGEVFPGLRTLHDVYVQDGRAYVAHWDAGTWIVDVSEPARPELVSRVRGRSAEELAALGQSDAIVESMEPPGNDHYATVDEDASLLGIGVESWDATPDDEESGGPGGIELYDISDPTDPRSLAEIEAPPSVDPSYRGVWTTSHNFDIAGGRLYSSWYRGGVKVYDVSDPEDPRELAAWADPSATSFWTAQSAGDVFVASSRENPSNQDAPGALFVFPDPPADATPSGSQTPAGSGTPATTRPPTPTATETATETPTPTETRTEESTASGPGFGVLGALAGLGIGARYRD